MTIGLVLGGGGSRGLAHIGVLQVLEKENIPIDLIVGTSMGGIVGILFALDIPLDQIAKGMRILQQKSLFNVKRWTIRSRQEMLREMLLDALDGKSFSDLKIPTSLMAVDMSRGTETLLQHGPLLPAALATSAVPTIFPPVEIEGIPLADGGVIDSLATHAAYQQGADKVIAVDIEPPLREGKQWVDPILAITGLQLPFISGSNDPSKIPNTLASMWRAYKVLTGHIHKERLKAHPPDVLLLPDVVRYGSLDFKELEGPIQAGVVEAERHLESLKNLADGM